MLPWQLSWRLPIGIVIVIGFFLFRSRETDEGARRRSRLMNSSRWCRRATRSFGVRYAAPPPQWHERAPVMLIANHMSWFDPIILFAIHPITFVTSTEIRDAPFLGWICKHAGCLFVERKKLRQVAEDRNALAGVLQSTSVAIFPEGTSSDGQGLLPFKGAPFAAAIAGQVPIKAWVLAYTRLAGRRFSRQNHQSICWYGDMGFLGSLIRLGLLGSLHVRIEPLAMRQPGRDRREVASEWHQQMSDVYQQSLRQVGSIAN